MELKEGKLTLRDRKLFLNSKDEINKDLKELPKFADGSVPSSPVSNVYSQYQQSVQNAVNQVTQGPKQFEHQGSTYPNRASSNETKATDANPNGAQAAAGINPWFAVGAWLGGGALNGINSVQGSNELLASAGTSNGMFNGIGYTKQNMVNGSSLMSEYDKGTKKAWLTNPAEALTRGLWGRDKQEQAIRQANQIAASNNNFAMAGAATQSLQLDNLKKEGDYRNQVLYAKNGKLPGFSNGLVARLSNGEIYGHINPMTGYVTDMHQAGHGKDNNDTLVRNLGNPTTSFVVTNKGGWSDYVRGGGSVNDALIGMQSGVRAPGYRCGKLPGFKEGMWGNAAVSGIGALASLGQIWDAASQDIASPNIYAANPYEQSALNDLAGLRINEYPILNRLNQQRAEADYALNNSGGLSGGQRARMRAANLATTQRNTADVLANMQAQNNQYRSQFANAQMQLGTQRAQRQQQANQFKSEMVARAHAAKHQGIQTGLANLLSQVQGFYANEFKRRQFNETMDLYRQQQALNQKEFDAWFNRINPQMKTPVENSVIRNPLGPQAYSKLLNTPNIDNLINKDMNSIYANPLDLQLPWAIELQKKLNKRK